MNYIVGNRELEISDVELCDLYIDEGSEVEVYRYNDEVLKIYKPYCIKNRLDEDTIDRLIGIDTKRIIMPNDIIRDDNSQLIGYTMPYIESYGLDEFKRMKIRYLIDELDIIKEDLKLLSKNHIDIEDMNIGNILVGNGIYFIDPGSYNISNYRENILYSLNKETINSFILKDILERFSRISKYDKKILEELIPIDDQYIGDILFCDYESNDNINKYVHRKVKSRL